MPTITDKIESSTGRALTVDEIRALPAAVDLVTAARAWNFGRTKAFELARRGEFPCPVLRIGNQYRVTRSDLLQSLGISSEAVLDGERLNGGPAAA